VGEIAKRIHAGAGAAAATTITPATAGVLMLLGVPPAGVAVTAALLGAGIQEFANFAALAWEDRAARATEFVTEVETASGRPFADVLQEASQDEALRDLLYAAADAALQTRHTWKIDVLARITASGVRDNAKVEVGLVLTDALRSVEPLHLRVLQILSRPGPIPIAYTAAGGERAEEYPWTSADIKQEDPGIAEVLDALISKLLAVGLIYNWAEDRYDPQARWDLTAFGQMCMEFLEQRGKAGSSE
jgi:hypothetical protein